MILGRMSKCTGRADIIEFGRHNLKKFRLNKRAVAECKKSRIMRTISKVKDSVAVISESLKDIGVGACTEHKKHQFCVVLFPYNQPVAIVAVDMTFPFAGIFTDKFMRRYSCGNAPVVTRSLIASWILTIGNPRLMQRLKSF